MKINKKSSKGQFYSKLSLLLIHLISLSFALDYVGVGERTKVEQLEIIDKYFVEINTIQRSNSSTTIPEHYRFVFKIRNKAVEMRFFGRDYENYNIGDKVKVESKIPLNIFRKPYITTYNFD
ncbi:MAG: hypothetical protein ACK4M9_22710 [Anaerobacillus sp.]|uniref:hypothetical protein n=1 Tax=Anaerobacillus sp. TaxID=1872506 RepID=UPI00391A7BE0